MRVDDLPPEPGLRPAGAQESYESFRLRPTFPIGTYVSANGAEPLGR
jgi:hypothetical protein